MITIENLTKKFKIRTSKKNGKYESITAIDNLNLSIKKGEIFGLIGPNGAGKTTTAKILSTLILPDIGTVKIAGYDVVKDANIIKQKIGLLAGEYARSLYWRLSGIRNLMFFAKLRGMWNAEDRINELIELFDLTDKKDELVMKYSTGMKHKLALATGLLHNPSVLFLDEPLTGIDPLTAYEIKDIIKNKFKEKTIIWASHNLYEIEEMCDRIALINNGRVILQGEPGQLGKNYWDHTKIMITCDKPDEFTILQDDEIIKGNILQDAEIKDNVVTIKTKNLNKTLSGIMYLAKIRNINIIELRTVKPSLEEIFIEGVKNNV